MSEEAITLAFFASDIFRIEIWIFCETKKMRAEGAQFGLVGLKTQKTMFWRRRRQRSAEGRLPAGSGRLGRPVGRKGVDMGGRRRVQKISNRAPEAHELSARCEKAKNNV